MIVEAFLFRPGDVIWYNAPHWSGYVLINGLLDDQLGARYDTDSCRPDGSVSPVSLRQFPPRSDVERHGRLVAVGR